MVEPPTVYTLIRSVRKSNYNRCQHGDSGASYGCACDRDSISNFLIGDWAVCPWQRIQIFAKWMCKRESPNTILTAGALLTAASVKITASRTAVLFPNFFKILFNIFPSASRSIILSFSFRCSPKNIYAVFLFPTYVIQFARLCLIEKIYIQTENWKYGFTWI